MELTREEKNRFRELTEDFEEYVLLAVRITLEIDAFILYCKENGVNVENEFKDELSLLKEVSDIVDKAQPMGIWEHVRKAT